MVDYVPIEKGTTIRQPSTANLMVDSLDRNVTTYPSAGNFQITKNNSIMNGFFTRIGTTEVVLNWNVPNIITGVNDTLIVTPTSTGVATTGTISQGFFTVGDCLNSLAQNLTIASATHNYTVTNFGGDVFLSCQTKASPAVDVTFTISAGTLQAQLGLPITVQTYASVPLSANLQNCRYLDFVSPELTYTQDVKDASTSSTIRNVLCRWYMAWDNPPVIDLLGFPIQMGYTPFQCRRIFNPPKQIRWEPNLPIGNLSFQVFKENGASPFNPEGVSQGSFNWYMTLQVSEV